MGGHRVVYGRNAVLEAVRAGNAITLRHLDPASPHDPIVPLVDLAIEQGIKVGAADRRDLDRLAGSRHHQGVVAWAKPLRFWDIEALIESALEEPAPAIFLLLDKITDPMNFGSILRAADGAGTLGIITTRRQSAPVTPVVARASAGALEHARIAGVANLPHAIRLLKDNGFWIIGSAPEADRNLWEADLPERAGVVVGSEGAGMSRLVRENCDLLISIPMRGQVASLNVAQAASLLLYELRRRSYRTPIS